MSKTFSVLSWNVEHFGGPVNRRPIQPIIDFIAAQDADVIALYEVESSHLYAPILEAMPDHHFFITEGEQIQEILVGIRQGVPAYITQKLEFKSGQSTLRPGVLATLLVDGVYYALLFLHLKSLPDPKGFGLRHDMIRRAYNFKQVLDKSAENPPVNYMFMGDLNTMGMDYYPKDKYDIPGSGEIAELKRFARYRKMRLLEKTALETFSNGSQSSYPPANLDHVVAANQMHFTPFNNKDVDVCGWVNEPTAQKQDEWIAKYSDHSLLYMEVEKA